MNTTPILRNIKSYVIRKGRMSEAQQRAVDQLFNLHASKQSDNRPFETLFAKQQEQVLEIGFGMGTSLAEHAQMYPELNFIGIEVHPPGVGCLLNLIKEHELNNVHVIQGDAVLALKTQCPDHSLSRINIFFPDPWQKQRHHKRRLIQPEFVALLAQKLKPQGILHLATDWEDYAKHMVKVLATNPNLKLVSNERGDRPATKFEQKGLDKGHPVFDMHYQLMS